MFFQGDLQAGIAKALQEQRLVGCFVHDDSAASSEWESWLGDEEVRPALERRVVLLNIANGSQEASFLAAFCPIPTVPSLLIINNGQVSTKLTAELSEVDFKASLRKELEAGPAVESLGNLNDSTEGQIPARPTVTGATPSSPSSVTDPVRSVLSERRARLEEDKKTKEAAEAADRKARAEARRVSAENLAGERRGSQSNHARELRKAQAEAKAERERILQRIEDDKRARKEREAHRRAQSKSEVETSVRSSEDMQRPGSGHSVSSPRSTSAIKECAVQVRLFDGSTIRQRFSSWKTLRTHVRPWIDSHRTDGDAPYSLRQVLVPMPNRSIEIAEEDEDLDSLGLYPSATLVMVPIKDFSEAYGSTGGVAKSVSAGYSIVNGIGNAIGSLFARSPPSSPSAGASFGQRSSEHIRTVESDGDEDEHHLYNGSGLNVEPRAPELKREDSWG